MVKQAFAWLKSKIIKNNSKKQEELCFFAIKG